MKTTFESAVLEEVGTALKKANSSFNEVYPGESLSRQPVHTVYGGAHLFKGGTAKKIGDIALKSLQEYGPDAKSFFEAIGAGFAETIYARVVEKLKREAVEDFRIDFEDGYGNRTDAEEDAHAAAAAGETAEGMSSRSLPPFIGIRIKPFSEETRVRGIRTLDLYVTALTEKTGGKLPSGFVVTLPKVTIPQQVSALSKLMGILESRCGIPSGALKIELMIETPQAIINSNGQSALPAFVDAAEGRCSGAHFGTYDYTALCNITAAYQEMTHGACDFARHVMQVSLAGRGLMLSDGATNVMPIAPHRPPAGASLTPAQAEENRNYVHRAWRLSYGHIRHSLKHGYYQGWDLHPAQIPVRYAAIYSFFLEGLDAASVRLKTFMEKAAQATLVGNVFDDAATGQGLLNFFLRGIACGAITEDEARATGLSIEEIRTRSFLKILNGRRKTESR